MKNYKLALLYVVASMMMACAPKLTDTVKVEGGMLQGVLTENPEVMVFKGVPYAAAPVGDLRWALPKPVIPWEGVKVADTFGAPSVQRGRQPSFSRPRRSCCQKELNPDLPVSCTVRG